MTKSNRMAFNRKLLRHISVRQNDEAKSMMNRDLAKASDNWGTLLHYAAISGNEVVARFLIELGSDINAIGMAGKTPLLLAVAFGRSKIVKVLLEAGANVDIVSAEGLSALQVAYRERIGDSEIVRAFYRRMKSEASTTEQLIERLFIAGCTVHHAVLSRDVELLKGLLQRGCDIHLKNMEGKTALHRAAEVHDVEMARILLANGANVNVLDNSHRSPLLIAVSKGNADVIEILLEKGADPNPQDFYAFTTLDALYADRRRMNDLENFDKCAAILLQYGAIAQRAFTVEGALNWPRSSGIDCLICHLALVKIIGTSTAHSILKDEQDLIKLEERYDECHQMLKHTVLDKVSLVDLLTDAVHKMRMRVRNETFVPKVKNFCSEHELSQLYPYYYITLMRRISTAESTVNLEEQAISAICKIFKRSHNECYLAAREIFNYLSLRDIQQLCQV